jgi:hypothetical protein
MVRGIVGIIFERILVRFLLVRMWDWCVHARMWSLDTWLVWRSWLRDCRLFYCLTLAHRTTPGADFVII